MSGPTTQRTFTAEQLAEARAAWTRWEAEASRAMRAEWAPWRRLAQRVGIIGPPAGSKWDAWTDDHPSQLAILTRAIRQTPGLLTEALLAPGVHSWDAAIAVLLRSLDELAERVEARNRAEDEAWARAKAEERSEAAEAYARLEERFHGTPPSGPDVTEARGVSPGFAHPPRGTA